MAFIDNGTWDGEYSSTEIYSDCVLGAPTLEKRAVKFITGVKKSLKIPAMNLSSVLQADSCVQSPLGNITLTDKEIQLCKMKFNIPICIQDLETTYMSESLMASGANNSDFPATPLAYVLDLLTRTINSDYERLIQAGDTTSLDPTLALCDGFLKKIEADVTHIPVAGVVLTAANIVAELTKVYDLIDDCLMDKPDLRFYMPLNTKKMLRQAISQSPSQVNNLGIGLVGNDDFDFFGIPIVFSHGITVNNILATTIANLQIGVDLLSDIDEVKVIKDDKNDEIYLKGRFFSGVEFYEAKYCVLYN